MSRHVEANSEPIDEYDDGLDVDSFRFTRETQMEAVEEGLRELGITKEELRAQAADDTSPTLRPGFCG